MPPRSKDPILIAGTGRVAQALGRLLAEHGEPVIAVVGRDPERARAAAAFIGPRAKPAAFGASAKRATRVLIAVSDSAIAEVAGRLAEDGMRRGIALHTCGALGPDALAPLAAAGVSCGALHPLQTFATPEQGLSALPGCLFAVDGDAAALEPGPSGSLSCSAARRCASRPKAGPSTTPPRSWPATTLSRCWTRLLC